MKFSLAILLFSLFIQLQGQTISSAASGNWSDEATWSGGVVPGANDDVLIQNGHVVVVDMNSAGATLLICHNLTVQPTGEVRLGYNGTDTFNKLGITGNIHCDGTIAAGRNVPTDINVGEGLIYDQNSTLIFQLTQPVTYLSGKGYIHPKSLVVQNQGSARELIIDHYNVVTDRNFIVTGTATVDVIIERYAYLSIGGTFGITGEVYSESPSNVSTNLINKGIIYTNNLNLYTKNAITASSITVASNGVITANQLNGGVTANSGAGGFLLELEPSAILRTGPGVISPTTLASADPNFTVVNNGDIKLHYGGNLSTAAQVSAELNAFDNSDRDLRATLKDRIGATHIAGWYNFTDQPFLEEGMSRFKEWGSRNIKTTISPDNGRMYNAYPFNHEWPTFSETAEVVEHAYVNTLFSDPYFTTHAFWAPTKGVNGYYKNGADRNHDRFLDTEEQIYRAAKAILTNYGHLNKTFIFQNWEGDWMLRGNNTQWEQNTANIPYDVMWQIEGMARMWRSHKRGIERAVEEFPDANARIQYAVEFNRMYYNTGGTRKTLMELNVPSVAEDVLPRVRVDLSSWSSYDGLFEEAAKPFPTGLWNGIEIATYFTNNTTATEGVPVQIGEIGLNENPPYNDLSSAQIEARYDKLVAMVARQGIPNVYLWNLYGSGAQSATLEKGVQYSSEFLYEVLDGKWIIEPDNSFGIAGQHLKDTYFLDLNADPQVNNPLPDVVLNEGFGSYTISLAEVFSDGNNDALTYTLSLTNSSIIQTEISGSDLIITEVSTGVTEITVSANDGYDGEAISTFKLIIVAEVDPSVAIGAEVYGSISDAILAANPGDVIDIRGIHTEVLQIQKDVTLRGTDPRTDKIQAAGSLNTSTAGVIYISRGNGVTDDLNITIENLGIRYGNAAENGGGIFADKMQGKLTLRNLIIEHNITAKNGGGVAIAGSDLDMIDCTIANNTALLDGGGVIVAPNNSVTTDSNIKIYRSLFDQNEARDGGALYINGNKGFGNSHFIDVYLENTIMTSNSAISDASTGKGGGAIWSKSAFWTGDNVTPNVNLRLVHGTLYRNSHASTAKNGIQFTSDPAGALTNFSVYNSILVSHDDLTESAINFANANTTAFVNNMIGGASNAPGWIEEAQWNNSIGLTASDIRLGNRLTDKGGLVYVLPILANSAAENYCIGVTGISLPLDDATGATRDAFPDAGAYECSDCENRSPEVVNALANLQLLEGFGTVTFDLSTVFQDPDDDNLMFTVQVNDLSVATANLNGHILTLLEVGLGTTQVTVFATDENGGSVSDAFSVTVSQVLGISTEQFKLYPNPASSSFQLDLGVQEGKIVLVNLQGIRVLEADYSLGKNYHVDQLSPGIYVVLVQLKNGPLLKTKLIISEK